MRAHLLAKLGWILEWGLYSDSYSGFNRSAPRFLVFDECDALKLTALNLLRLPDLYCMHILLLIAASLFQKAPSGETGSIMLDVATGAAGKSGEIVCSVMNYTLMYSRVMFLSKFRVEYQYMHA